MTIAEDVTQGQAIRDVHLSLVRNAQLPAIEVLDDIRVADATRRFLGRTARSIPLEQCDPEFVKIGSNLHRFDAKLLRDQCR